MGFIELEKRLRLLVDSKLLEFMEEILTELEPEIVRMNREQLERGEKADGSFFQPYSWITVQRRAEAGNPVKNQLIALYDTGDFWAGFWAKAYNNKLSLFSDDVKTEMLVGIYGNYIFGLTQENFEALGNRVNPLLKQKVGQFLQQ